MPLPPDLAIDKKKRILLQIYQHSKKVLVNLICNVSIDNRKYFTKFKRTRNSSATVLRISTVIDKNEKDQREGRARSSAPLSASYNAE